MKNAAMVMSTLSLSILLACTDACAEERFTLRGEGRTLEAIVHDLALEHDIRFENSGLIGRERLDIEMTDTLNNMFSRLLKGYNHAISFDGVGRIRSVTVISAKLANNSFDESILPTGELMSEEN
jgi:hypothetical protein